MNLTQHGRMSVVVDKEDYEELERLANRTAEDVRKDSTELLKGVVQHLRKMNNPMSPWQLADFIETRMGNHIKEMK